MLVNVVVTFLQEFEIISEFSYDLFIKVLFGIHTDVVLFLNKDRHRINVLLSMVDFVMGFVYT